MRDLAVMLNPYAKGGQYARFFSGRNTIDFSNDFVVIESEELKRKPDLQAVVNIILFHAITREMYLTRNRKKVWFIDELKQQLGDSSENTCYEVDAELSFARQPLGIAEAAAQPPLEAAT